MTKYWGAQLDAMEIGMSKLRVYQKSHPNSPTLATYVAEKQQKFDTFKSLTRRFCPLGTESIVVQRYLQKVKKNHKNEHFEDPVFLQMLNEEEFFFSLNPEIREKVRKEEEEFLNPKEPSPTEGEQISFEDLLK